MDNNNLVQNEKYIIHDNNNPYVRYFGTYDKTDSNGLPVHKFTKIFKLSKTSPPEPYARSYSFPVNSVSLQLYTPSPTSALGKRTTQIDDDQNKRARSVSMQEMMKASYLLHNLKEKVRNGYSLTDEENEAISKALSIIPKEEHYRWPEFTESLEALDGGKRARRVKSKSKKSKKRKSRKYNK